MPLPSAFGDSPPSESLPRARVIRQRGTFDATRTRGRRVHNRWMTLNHLARDPARSETGSVAFLTPKRIGSAVVRVRLRRQMREIYRRHLAQPGESSYLIWIPRPIALELDFEGLKKCMTELRNRLR